MVAAFGLGGSASIRRPSFIVGTPRGIQETHSSELDGPSVGPSGSYHHLVVWGPYQPDLLIVSVVRRSAKFSATRAR